MAKQIEGVSERILTCAKAEFLDKGYTDASLRVIAAAAETSTNSIYVRFGGKEGLFSAIVEPALNEMTERFLKIQEAFHHMDRDAQAARMAEYADGGPAELVDYIYEHLDEFRLLLDASYGTRFHNFVDALVRIEGENAVYKSDSVLSPTYDNSTSAVSPSDPKHMVYNTIGSGNWKKALQTITWQVDAGTLSGDGWYKLGIKARQEEMRGFYSNRRIYIDGQVLCQEMDQVKFYYNTDFQMTNVQDSDGEDVYVYLTAGEDHTITMEAIPGEIGDSMRQLDAIVLDLNTYYRKIVMITGPEPDKYTDYYVHEKIPELVDEFSRMSAELKEIQGHIEELQRLRGRLSGTDDGHSGQVRGRSFEDS